MLGFIVMVDSTRPETFREARNILETFRAYAPTPYVVAANKQDVIDSWELEDMRIALRLDPKVKLLPCIAREKEAVKKVLELLYIFWLKWKRLKSDISSRKLFYCASFTTSRYHSLRGIWSRQPVILFHGWLGYGCGRKRWLTGQFTEPVRFLGFGESGKRVSFASRICLFS
jgi:hypothetical protein